MKFNFDRKLLFKIFAYTLMLLLAPFAFELVIMADIMGVEAAIAFLFIYGKAAAISAVERIVLGYNVMRAILQSHSGEHHYPHKLYAIGTVSSLLLFWFSGSLLLALVAWMPSVVDLTNTI